MTIQFASPEDFSTQEQINDFPEDVAVDHADETIPHLSLVSDVQSDTDQRSERMQDYLAEIEFRATLAGIRRASMKFHGVPSPNRRHR